MRRDANGTPWWQKLKLDSMEMIPTKFEANWTSSSLTMAC